MQSLHDIAVPFFFNLHLKKYFPLKKVIEIRILTWKEKYLKICIEIISKLNPRKMYSSISCFTHDVSFFFNPLFGKSDLYTVIKTHYVKLLLVRFVLA